MNNIDPEVLSQRSNTPGPGTYNEVIKLDKYGRSHVSNIVSSKAAAWSPSKNRFPGENTSLRGLPGPGNYNPTDSVGGSYLLSTNKNVGSIKMRRDTTTSQRVRIAMNKICK